MMHVLFGHEYMCVGVGVCANVCVHECVIHPHPLLSTMPTGVCEVELSELMPHTMAAF